MTAGDAAAPPDVGGFGVSADGKTVFVGVGTQVLAVSAAGGPATQVVVEAKSGLVGTIAVSGTTLVYPTGLNGDVDAPIVTPGMVEACGVEDADSNVIQTGAGHLCPRLARSQGSLFQGWAFATATNGYWIDGAVIKTEILGGQNAGGINDGVAFTVSQPIVAAAANASTRTIYFAEYGLDPVTLTAVSYIEKTPLAINSTQILMQRGQGNVTSMTVDASRVYWARADCSIYSAPQ
jgi:hypothetical protein